MTVKSDVLLLLEQSAGGLTDGQLASALGKNHAQINVLCRQLETDGNVVRDRASGQIVNREPAGPSIRERPPVESAATAPQEWFGEASVQAALVAYLAGSGWAIKRVADTVSRERGVDVVAERAGQQLLVEVKGWPSTRYARGPRAGEEKPTHPSVQAKVWYADVLLAVARLRQTHREGDIAIGLPDLPRYRSLLAETSHALAALKIQVLLVSEPDQVRSWKPDGAR